MTDNDTLLAFLGRGQARPQANPLGGFMGRSLAHPAFAVQPNSSSLLDALSSEPQSTFIKPPERSKVHQIVTEHFSRSMKYRPGIRDMPQQGFSGGPARIGSGGTVGPRMRLS